MGQAQHCDEADAVGATYKAVERHGLRPPDAGASHRHLVRPAVDPAGAIPQAGPPHVPRDVTEDQRLDRPPRRSPRLIDLRPTIQLQHTESLSPRFRKLGSQHVTKTLEFIRRVLQDAQLDERGHTKAAPVEDGRVDAGDDWKATSHRRSGEAGLLEQIGHLQCSVGLVESRLEAVCDCRQDLIINSKRWS